MYKTAGHCSNLQYGTEGRDREKGGSGFIRNQTWLTTGTGAKALLLWVEAW